MRAFVCIALAGVASGAMGQTGTLNIVSNSDTSLAGSFTLSIYASADFGTHIVGGEFAIVDGVDDAGTITGMEASAAPWAAVGENDRGWTGGVNHAGLVFGQFVFLPPFPPSPESSFLNGEALVATIIVEYNHSQPPSLMFPLGFVLGEGLGPFTLEIYDEADGSITQLGADDVQFGSTGIPAPSSAMILGLGGLVAGRRRRRR